MQKGRYVIEADGSEKRAGIFIGPEFGTVSREDLVRAAREAGDAAFDVIVSCAFSYDAHSADFNKLGRIRVLKASMFADLHMAEDLKNTGKGNLFVIFGEPDIQILESANCQIQVKLNGVDVFHPSTGEVRSNGPDEIVKGSSTLTTTKKAFLCDRHISWVRMIPTRLSRRH